MTEQTRTMTEQLAEAKANADTTFAAYQDRHRQWNAKLQFMASNSSFMHGSDLTRHMDSLNQLAREAYAAHQYAEIADKVLASLIQMAKNQNVTV